MTRTNILLGGLLGCSMLLEACGGAPIYKVVQYQPAYRQEAPQPVYSRLMWSHLPEPVKPRTRPDAPLMLPDVFVELKDVTVDEAVEALAQTMGYRWENSVGASGPRISVHMEGNVEEILGEIKAKSNMPLELSHEDKVIRLADKRLIPSLPSGVK
jgi:hypothetical protein